MQFGNRKLLYLLQYIKSTEKNLNSILQRIRETKEEISKRNVDIKK